MKKIVFTIQVFGIVAMFPLCFILELNHGKEELFEKKTNVVVTAKAQKTSTKVFVDADAAAIKGLFYLNAEMGF